MGSTDRDIDAEAPTVAPGAEVDGAAPTLDSQSGERGVVVLNGTAIGRFVVSGILGQGGMGVVVRAHDPELARAVAIKLLRPDQRGQGGVRLGREAQAMAKLSHPNVVTVYDVGEHDGSTYIAMELVDGRTLRAWWGAAPRTWRQVVEIYVAAGRGLAAAHAAGLVHRDFKPDNVLIGDDGRPRVTDFGLVAAESRAVESADTHGVALDSNLTVRGALLGTPGYMAPEQWRGDAVDARSDQFAFCVALWEALHGERPFAGDTTLLLREAVLDGAIRAPRARVPRWLTAALTRGLDREPAARWPRLSELLDHLAARARPRRGLAIAAVVGGLAVAGGGVAYAVWPAPAASCNTHEQRLVRIWDDPRRDGIRAALGDSAPDVIHELDGYATTWVATRVDACVADRRGERTAAVQAARSACFDEALGQLDGVAGAIAGGGLDVNEARTAVQGLPTLARCSDLQVLTAVVPRPTDAARAKRLVAVEQTLARAQTQELLGHFQEARELAAGVRAEAEAIDYPPTTAAVLLVIAGAAGELGDNVAAEEALRAALRAADAGRDDHARLEAYLALIDVVGAALGRWDEAKTLLADARSVLVRIQAPKQYQARLLAFESNLVAAQGDDEGALALLQQALPLYEEAFGTEGRPYGELEYSLAGMLLSTGDVAAAEPMLEHCRAILVRYVGEDAPLITKVDNARAFARYARGDLDGAIALQQESLAIRERAEGADSPTLGNGLYTLGAFYKVAGRTDEAIATLTRALGLIEREHGKDHPRVVMALNELAETCLVADRFAEGTPYATRAVEMADRLELGDDIEAKARYMLASALWTKDRRRALALALRARDEYRAAGDEDNAKTIDAWLASPD